MVSQGIVVCLDILMFMHLWGYFFFFTSTSAQVWAALHELPTKQSAAAKCATGAVTPAWKHWSPSPKSSSPHPQEIQNYLLQFWFKLHFFWKSFLTPRTALKTSSRVRSGTLESSANFMLPARFEGKTKQVFFSKSWLRSCWNFLPKTARRTLATSG